LNQENGYTFSAYAWGGGEAMAQGVPLSNQITIGAQPTEKDLNVIAAEGVRSVVNLVPEGEDPSALSPEQEGCLARQLGMKYLHVPVPAGDVKSPARVVEFVKGFEALPRPVFVHCKAGRRAGVG
jgi:uncharacterized protein (TIGR01244 family)